MRKIKEVLRLYHDVHLSERAISRSVNLSRDTVLRILSRFSEVGLSRPLNSDIDDTKLETLLFPNSQGRPQAVPLYILREWKGRLFWVVTMVIYGFARVGL
ncbi:helix-turn-helix domain-containing protein [Alicyclobacillus mengziensis]|uniref:Helix-turn-helix domain-containing protein n=1 Tax=Alicyclobacillus mengziensis TaxID=2931921 RepID=A0A9X7W143_9BACL|nr:helix-turn-helix domain-containing protein [Alicyclobacillus mengziensis]QSO48517.1 helix-turn-helix domain-containing protein [Alicyclobacillus mengziensis]